jgi:hypothetical protein
MLGTKSVKIGWVFLTMLLTPCFASQSHDLRGKRFCEIIIIKGKVFEIYNTIHSNECPELIWSQINEKNVKQETGANYVVLDGPRQYIADGVKRAQFIDNTPKTIQNLTVRKSSILILSYRETLFGSQPFHEHHVNRNTVWNYAAGKRIYELIDNKGHVYIMLSFTMHHPIRDEADLSRLEKHLKLPKGWQFKTGILAQSIDVEPQGYTAVVIQDNMKNTYQLASRDFLD